MNNSGKIYMNQILKLLRIANDITMDELALKLGISKSYISSIESGNRRVTEDLLKNYSKVFKIPQKTLLFFEETANKNKLKTQEILILILSKICSSKKLNCNVEINDF